MIDFIVVHKDHILQFGGAVVGCVCLLTAIPLSEQKPPRFIVLPLFLLGEGLLIKFALCALVQM